jgi:hypothetical protein
VKFLKRYLIRGVPVWAVLFNKLFENGSYKYTSPVFGSTNGAFFVLLSIAFETSEKYVAYT